MRPDGKFRNGVRAGVVVVLLATGALAAGCSSGSGGTAAPTANQTSATYAEQPPTPPNYIFPFMSLAFFSVANSEQFQYLMYRPLYWFGQGATPNLNPSLSLAQPPVYSNNNKTVTINLNPYKWSNGETVTAENVMFWMNMLHAEKANWAGVLAGGHPRRRRRASPSNSPTQLTMHADRTGQHLLVHLQRAVPDHPDAQRLGHHRHGWRPQLRGLRRRAPTGRPTPPAPRSTPSCPSRPATTRPTRRRPTTRCPPTPPTPCGRWSTGRGS